MNTPTDNAWLDSQLDEIWDSVKPATQLGIKQSYADWNWGKLQIKALIDIVCREAYKKGYIDRGVGELTK